MSQPNQQVARTQAKAISPMEDLRNAINNMEGQFKLVLPPHVPVEKFTRTVITAIQNNKDLMECERASLFSACLECATDGLLPDGREAAIVPYKNKHTGGKDATYMPMVGGLLKMLRISGELSTITPNIVCEKDEFDYWIDETGEHLKHRPFMDGPRGDITHAYVIARNKDGTTTFEVMSKIEIEQVRESSKAKNSGPWTDWYGEMAKKTVIRRISKRLAMSTEIERVVHRDDKLYDFDVTPPKTDGAKRSRLAGIIDSKNSCSVPSSGIEIESTSQSTETQAGS